MKKKSRWLYGVQRFADFDPNKICDNCGKCLDIKEFAAIRIDKVYTNPADYEREQKKETR